MKLLGFQLVDEGCIIVVEVEWGFCGGGVCEGLDEWQVLDGWDVCWVVT